MRYRIRCLIVSFTIVLVTLCIVSALVAQDSLTETFIAEDQSFSFVYPSGWNVVEQEPGKAVLSNDDITIIFYGPGFVDRVVDEIDTNDLEAALSSFLETGGMVTSKITSISVGDATVAQAEIESVLGVGVAFGVDFGDETMGMVVATMPDDVIEDFAPMLLEIVGSFGLVNDDSGGTSDIVSRALQAAQSQISVTCTVRVEQEGTASVRVGPGTNRTAILYLPANRDFSVLGQAQANDGEMWWKLDKDEVAPNTAAAELWVAQNQVIASEDCYSVPNVEPPPIIPIVVAADVLPTSGVWIASTPTLSITCPGMGTTTIGDTVTFRMIVQVVDEGRVIIVDGDRYNRISPGTYQLQAYDTELGPITITLRVVAENRIEGEMTGSSEGCTFSMTITMTLS